MASHAPASGRLDWVDAGRGLAIFLVVMFHCAQWLAATGLDVTGWIRVNETIATLRLPVFFVFAGLFAQKWMVSSWAALWRVKLSLFVWVYVLWSVIATFTFMLGLRMQGAEGNYLAQLANLPLIPLAPRFELWFIWALAIFFVVARLIRAVPVAVQLAITGALSFAALSWSAAWLPGANTGWTGMAKYFFFFLVGLHLRSWILRVADRATRTWLIAGFLAWCATATVGTATGWSQTVPGYYFATCLLGLAGGLGVAKVLSHAQPVRRLGAHTLPVYVTHTSVILVIAWALSPVLAILAPLWAWPVVPALALTAVAISLGLSRLVDGRPPLEYLYEPPAWFSRARQLR